MLNQITLMGRFTRAPELKQTPNGTAVVSFSLACDRDFSSSGEKQTDFINCVAWRTTAEFISKYFQKGSLCVINGSLQIRRWKDKQDNSRDSAEVTVNNIYFAESRKDTSAAKPSSNNLETSEPLPGSLWDKELEAIELPF